MPGAMKEYRTLKGDQGDSIVTGKSVGVLCLEGCRGKWFPNVLWHSRLMRIHKN